MNEGDFSILAADIEATAKRVARWQLTDFAVEAGSRGDARLLRLARAFREVQYALRQVGRERT